MSPNLKGFFDESKIGVSLSWIDWRTGYTKVKEKAPILTQNMILVHSLVDRFNFAEAS